MYFNSGGDLAYHLELKRHFSEGVVAFLVAEICSGLWFLHAQTIVYRDLKSNNIMLDAEGMCQLITMFERFMRDLNLCLTF